MAVKALFLGSIGVIAETSAIQREAYNAALAEVGLGWRWDRSTYAALLEHAGGRDRLRLLSDATGAGLSEATIESVHRRKTEIACARILEEGVVLRPGVGELIETALARGVKTALVTSTYRANVDAIAAAAGAALPLQRFAAVITRDDVAAGKPAPDAYRIALKACAVAPDEAIAIEDTAASVAAARGAGVKVLATPGAFTRDQVIVGAEAVLQTLANGEGRLDPAVAEFVFGD